MFTINNDQMDNARTEKTNVTAPDPGATQRVNVNSSGAASSTPARKKAPAAQSRNAAPVRRTSSEAVRAPSKTPKKKRKKNNQLLLIGLCVLAAILLALIIWAIIGAIGSGNDDGRIGNNIFAAGVDLSGMTVDQAERALEKATKDTYSSLDMVVQVLDSTIVLSPKDTGAQLDTKALAKAAYEYSRENSRLDNTPYTISILPYLTLDKGFIQNAVNQLGDRYGTTLSQPSYTVEGTRPTANPDPATIDLNRVHQMLTIQIGTAEYGLSTDTLFEQIMDAYNINIFQVTGECTVIAPEALDCEALFNELCTAPVDASMDPTTYVVTPEVYGYGFLLNDLKAKVANAKYGDVLTIPLRYIEPDITTKVLSEDLFKDVLGSFSTKISGNKDWNSNMNLVCQILNGKIIKSGEIFSFNNVVGEPTLRGGYKPVNTYYGKSYTSIIGAGISQVASTLYASALAADLDILERNPNVYAPDYIDPGYDAQVFYGTMDLQLRNNTEQPIRIVAQIVDGAVEISLIGTDTKDFYVEVVVEIDQVKNPGTETVLLPENNPGGYKDGDVISQGAKGYKVSVYKFLYDKLTGQETDEELVNETSYAKRNNVVVEIEEVVIPTEPSEPTEAPSDPTDPSDPSTPENE